MRRSRISIKYSSPDLNSNPPTHPLAQNISDSQLTEKPIDNPLAIQTQHINRNVTNPQQQKDEPFNESFNPYWIHFKTSPNLKQTRSMMLGNKSIVLALPIIKTEEKTEEKTSEQLEILIDNYIFYAQSNYEFKKSENIRFTTSSGIFGTLKSDKILVQGFLPDEHTINQLIQDQSNNKGSKQVKTMFDVLLNSDESTEYTILTSKEIQIFENSSGGNINVIFINKEIENVKNNHYNSNIESKPKNIDKPHSVNTESISNKIKGDGNDITSNSNTKGKSIDEQNKLDSLDNKIKTLNESFANKVKQLVSNGKLFAKCLQRQSYSSETSGNGYIALNIQEIETMFNNLVDFSTKFSEKLAALIEPQKQKKSIGLRDFSFTLSKQQKNYAEPSNFKNLESLAKEWQDQIEIVIHTIRNSVSLALANSQSNELEDSLYNLDIEDLAKTVEQSLFDYHYTEIIDAILFLGGSANEDLLSSQIASLSLAGIELTHLGIPHLYLEDTTNCEENEDGSKSLNPSKDKHDELVLRIGEKLEGIHKMTTISEILNSVVLAVEYGSALIMQSKNIMETKNNYEKESETSKEMEIPRIDQYRLSQNVNADLLLPVLIYSLIKTNPTHIFTTLQLIDMFHSKLLIDSFSSYCLTSLMAAVMYLQNVRLDDLKIDKNVTHTTDSGLDIDHIQASPKTNILGGIHEIPDFLYRVPLVSNVGNLGYGLVSGVAGAAAGVYGAVVNRRSFSPPLGNREMIKVSNIENENPKQLLKEKNELKFAPINTDFLNIKIHDLKVSQLPELLDSYQQLANYIIQQTNK
ncbi:hypothetical protein BB559_003520 [Furculomyces boomerangus]|uniref:VPS9 domain-containing protein n=1 Tax=Furculomyces boomerangus TaxID=61424 RepID=A0A2T9YKU7_9FUNG|nr:hypothetical protein BB559_003520 [Furculomyces boomerangus]